MMTTNSFRELLQKPSSSLALIVFVLCFHKQTIIKLMLIDLNASVSRKRHSKMINLRNFASLFSENLETI